MTTSPDPGPGGGERGYADWPADRLLHFLKLRDRQIVQSQNYWLRAAEEALAGDPRALRLRVEMAKMPPVDIIQSASDSGGA